MNGCLRLKGDVSYRKEGGEREDREGRGERGGEVGWKGERGEEGDNGQLLLHIILIIGNYCKTE